MENIFLGVSGGVDSFVAALLLKEQGYNVTGIYLDMGIGNNPDIKTLSSKLGIDVLHIDASENFKKYVLDHFTDTYMKGGVPSPCVECNKYVKWKYLLDTADSMGSGLLSTGHYCNVSERDGIYYIEKGTDPVKDQSYYMWKMEQRVLSRAVFPLGRMLKEDVRKIAFNNGYSGNLEKKESMGLCFLRDKSVKEFLIEKRKDAEMLRKGEIVDKNGNVIGIHDGYPFYTLAQKRGLGLDKKMCVTAIDNENNRLIVGNAEDLYTYTIRINNLNIMDLKRLENCKDLRIKVRGVGWNPAGKAHIKINDDQAVIELEDPAWAVAKGQPVVLYDNETVLGGGEAM